MILFDLLRSGWGLWVFHQIQEADPRSEKVLQLTSMQANLQPKANTAGLNLP